MPNTERSQREAAAALRATITDIVTHGEGDSNPALAQKAVNAIAHHTIAIAQARTGPDTADHLYAGIDE